MYNNKIVSVRATTLIREEFLAKAVKALRSAPHLNAVSYKNSYETIMFHREELEDDGLL